MGKNDITKLCCRDQYCMKPVRYLSEDDCNNTIYQMFGSLIGQDFKFIRTWVRVFAATNQKYVKDLAKSYFKSKGMNYLKWISEVKGSARTDVLVLFLLSKVTQMHCVVHLNEGHYWSTLFKEPKTHDEFIFRFSVCLTYIGNGIYVQLVLRTTLLDYVIFDLTQATDEPETKPFIVGSLTSEENEALNTGINPEPEHLIPSASARCEMDIPRVEKELRTSCCLAELPAPDLNSFLHLPEELLPSTSGNNDPVQSQSTKEPVLKIRHLSKKDTDAAISNLKKGSNTNKKNKKKKHRKQICKDSKTKRV